MEKQLTIPIRVTKHLPVIVLSFRWIGTLGPPISTLGPLISTLTCSSCGHLVGCEKPFGLAWVEDRGDKRSMRLCNACGLIAEAANTNQGPQI